MEKYIVGGAVRDKLLGRCVSDKDWVVIGQTPQAMLSAGFKQVGHDFPVFLHPKTYEEHALARTEKKVGKGYSGFECIADPSVKLDQDLLRRDLTINAIAQNEGGQLFDPFNGVDDLNNRILRHVSDAFSEDPLRLLRIARFNAQLSEYDFKIAQETMLLLKEITLSGELEHLTEERVFKELEKALASPMPSRFFQVLRQCGALKVLFPEIDALYNTPNPGKWHPEICTAVHTYQVVNKAKQLSDDPAVVYASLLHDLGKALTPKDVLPSHHGHEDAGVPLVKAFCKKWKVPKKWSDLAVLTCQWHTHCHRALELKPKTVLKVLLATNALRQKDKFEQWLLACQADAQGRPYWCHEPYPSADYLRQAADAARQIKIPEEIKTKGGQAIADWLHKERLSVIAKVKSSFIQ